MDNKLRLSYLLAMLGWFSLFALLCFNIIMTQNGSELPRSIQLLILPGPLLIFLKGMLHGKPKTHLFASIAALVYFSLGVSTAIDAGSRSYGLLLVLCSVLLFTGGVLYARLGGRHLNKLAQSSN